MNALNALSKHSLGCAGGKGRGRWSPFAQGLSCAFSSSFCVLGVTYYIFKPSLLSVRPQNFPALLGVPALVYSPEVRLFGGPGQLCGSSVSREVGGWLEFIQPYCCSRWGRQEL